MSFRYAFRPLASSWSDLWQAPHRPLFLMAALWSAAALAWWQWAPNIGLAAPSLGTPAYWHAHEMIFGFACAAAGAYLLTAAPSWTGRPSPSGLPLKVLVAFWGSERLVMLLAESLPIAVLIAPGLGYFGLLGALLARDILAARRWDKIGFPLAVVALGLADAVFTIAARNGWTGPDSRALLHGVVVIFAILLSVIGGKMLPAFTGNWLRQTCARIPEPAENRQAGLLSRAALLMVLVLTLADARSASALALLAAGGLELWRMAGWRSFSALRNPLLAMLHLSYLWLPAGLMMAGIARLMPDRLPESDALHALTIGAMGGMILAVGARAAARRQGGVLRAGKLLPLAFALIWCAAWLRIVAPVWPEFHSALVSAAAVSWCAGWGVFLLALLPGLRGPVRKPVFSGTRA